MNTPRILYYNLALNGPEGPASHARETLQALLRIPALVVVLPELEDALYRKGGVSPGERSRAGEWLLETLRVIRGLTQTGLDLYRMGRVILRSGRNRPDVILTRTAEYNIAAALARHLFGGRLLTEVNGLLYQERALLGRPSFTALRRVMEKFSIESSDGIFTVSAELLPVLTDSGIRPKKAMPIPNGVDVNKFKPDVPPHPVIDGLRREGHVVIGFTGSLYPWHGVDVLIRAMAQVHELTPAARCVIVGNGSERKRLEAEVRRLGLEEIVRFLGSVPHHEVPACVSGFDIAVAPYNPVGQFYFSPLKVYEYMAAAKPVVGSRLGQMIALFDDGQGGVLVPQGDSLALGHALAELALDGSRRANMGARNRVNAVERHSWDATVRKILALYEDAVKQ